MRAARPDHREQLRLHRRRQAARGVVGKVCRVRREYTLERKEVGAGVVAVARVARDALRARAALHVTQRALGIGHVGGRGREERRRRGQVAGRARHAVQQRPCAHQDAVIVTHAGDAAVGARAALAGSCAARRAAAPRGLRAGAHHAIGQQPIATVECAKPVPCRLGA
eukprot:6468862-Prymnesium_polylepis.1